MVRYPIARASIGSFGTFQEIDVKFSPGLNVIVGDNATGKSQLLKLLYSCTKTVKDARTLTKKDLNSGIASKLMGVFRPEKLGRLTQRTRGKSSAEVTVKYANIRESLKFGFSSHAKREVNIQSVPDRQIVDEPVFLPPNELLSFASRFLGLYNTYETGFEETWKDTTEYLLRPTLRGPRGHQANEVLFPFSNLLQGGTVIEEDGQFYLKQPGIGNLEAPLLAEGHRKLAMILRLIANGVLLGGGYLFWDEPEANLNPSSQRAVAHALVQLVNNGTQIFVATHSMFLLRELQMNDSITPRYIGLKRSEGFDPDHDLAEVALQVRDDLDDLDFVAALEAESEQSQRYLAW